MTPVTLEEFSARILESPGSVMLVGPTDSGKTTVSLSLARRCAAAGLKVAVVDGDVGQSNIGPPGAVSVSLIDREISCFEEVPLTMLHFVGSHSPEPLIPEVLLGTKEAVDYALKAGSEVVIVDTSGLVLGSLGRRLKLAKLQLVRPRYLLVLERRPGLARVFQPVCDVIGTELVSLCVKDVQRKSMEERRRARETRFGQYFADAGAFDLRLERVSLRGTFLGTGIPFPPREVESLGRGLDCGVVYLERIPEGIFAIVDGGCDRLTLEQLKRRTGSLRLFSVELSELRSLIVGLFAQDGTCLGEGILTEIDVRGGTVRVITPVRDAVERVCLIRLGLLKISPDGRELGRAEPGTF